MKLKRYGQFVKGINEDREAEYDKVEDFRKQMDMLDDDAVAVEDEPTGAGRRPMMSEDPYASRMGGRNLPMPEEGEEGEDTPGMGWDSRLAGDAEEFEVDDEDYGDEDEYATVGDEGDMPGEVDTPKDEPTGNQDKLAELTHILGVEVEVDEKGNTMNQVRFGEHVVNYYSETGNLHIGSKEFETAEDAAKFLQGGKGRMVRDTNESRSYRFKRKNR